jgi:hypothetical protein
MQTQMQMQHDGDILLASRIGSRAGFRVGVGSLEPVYYSTYGANSLLGVRGSVGGVF